MKRLALTLLLAFATLVLPQRLWAQTRPLLVLYPELPPPERDVFTLMRTGIQSVAAGPKDDQGKRAESRADVNLLTGSDTRTLGLESVGADLKETQRRQRELQGQLERLAQQASTKDELKALSAQLEAIAQSLKDEGGQRSLDAEVLRRRNATPASGSGATTPTVPTPADRNGTSKGGLFEEADVAKPTGTSTSRTTRRSDAAGTIKVQVFGEADPQAAAKQSEQGEGIYIPAGDP